VVRSCSMPLSSSSSSVRLSSASVSSASSAVESSSEGRSFGITLLGSSSGCWLLL
jgi:hypothetical protein